ncbi:MAG: bifunctional phosphoribosylaminoimidazolecarboxamide formyltransferase/IMP cyclohydrolase [Deltaproteobacteria bacterium]|nr:bifunctional phosphoribosylaminoimidazolecarboxamide formyltransferase/IMP cyclohydrolase [Deltaproteobacteria bacterium]
MRKIRRAIISVTDKGGIESFAKELSNMGVEIISTGGTAELLKNAGIPVIGISNYTGFPEMLDGRLKTLHPKIHGGILGQRDKAEHAKQMQEHGILSIDMVVVNLYAFEDTIAKGCSLEEAVENIDIGGPTMIRAAAKNHKDVAVVVDPADYQNILDEIKKNNGGLSYETRFYLAKKVFQLTARYDGAISNYLGRIEGDAVKKDFPDTFAIQVEKSQDLRYGENPHQQAAFYRESNRNKKEPCISNAKQLHGKELSFNNILDLNSAIELAKEFHEPSCVIVKHNNPCGVAMSKKGLLDAYQKALSCDKVSVFGGIIAINRRLDAKTAKEMSRLFLEAIAAPGFDGEALEILKDKKNLRLLEIPEFKAHTVGRVLPTNYDLKKINGGLLVQTADIECAQDLKTVTKLEPTDAQLEDLLFAWNVCKHVKSNAIIFAKNTQTVGIGAGQMSRIDSTRLGIMKAKDAGLDVQGTVMASDAFFPFRDNVDKVAEAGITAIIQPGGSVKDEEVIKAADGHNIAMVFTGIRHFRH